MISVTAGVVEQPLQRAVAENVVLDVTDQPLPLLGTVSGTFSSSTTWFSSARTSACSCSSLSDGSLSRAPSRSNSGRGRAVLELRSARAAGAGAREPAAVACRTPTLCANPSPGHGLRLCARRFEALRKAHAHAAASCLFRRPQDWRRGWVWAIALLAAAGWAQGGQPVHQLGEPAWSSGRADRTAAAGRPG